MYIQMCIIKQGRAFQLEAIHLDSRHQTSPNCGHIRPRHVSLRVSTPVKRMSHFGSLSKKMIKKGTLW